jgi:hypothetical protein
MVRGCALELVENFVDIADPESRELVERAVATAPR